MSSLEPVENSNFKHALVLDQQPGIRSAVNSILSSLGFRVTESECGRHALAIATRKPCLDLLISETQPLGVDAWTLATSFLRTCPVGRVVMMSGGDEEVDSINSESPGAWRFVPKSRLAGMLLEAIHSVGLLQPRRVILLADDEPMVRNVVQAILARSGYAIITAADGQEAMDLSRAYSGKIDLVLSDIKMPGLNGIQLAECIRQQRPGTPVLLMSGFAPQDALPPGAVLINKPFDYRNLVARIRELLGIETKADTQH